MTGKISNPQVAMSRWGKGLLRDGISWGYLGVSVYIDTHLRAHEENISIDGLEKEAHAGISVTLDMIHLAK